MRLYLMQHGKAVLKEENPDQPLSDIGRQDVEAVAGFLHAAGLRLQSIFHSGKTRARQTAEVIAAHLNSQSKIIEKAGLTPLDEVASIAQELEEKQEDLMLVGHLPHLAKLASRLIAENESLAVVQFQQGSVACLQKNPEGTWSMAWMLIPELIRMFSINK
ncbi:phosphohistidine phosphatase SixA [bacterium]|nr:phosphohistidine phosphatase SixA [bacterium]